MSCECKTVINELLCFIQNKCQVMDELSLVQICSSWYNEEEIENAKTFLCEITGNRKTIRKGDKKAASNISDILKLIKESENLPKFVAGDLNRLPPVTFDHLDVSSLLKTLACIRNEMQIFKDETRHVISKLEGEITELRQQRAPASVAGQYSFASLPSAPSLSERPLQVQNADVTVIERAVTPLKQTTVLNFRQAVLSKQAQPIPSNENISENVGNDGFIQVSRGRKRQRIENYTVPRQVATYQSKNKRGTNTTSTLKAAEQKIPIYVSRFANECTEEDIKNYFTENGHTIYGIETLNQRKNTDFKSFKVVVAKKDLESVLKEEFWPESIVFRIYKQGKNDQVTDKINI